VGVGSPAVDRSSCIAGNPTQDREREQNLVRYCRRLHLRVLRIGDDGIRLWIAASGNRGDFGNTGRKTGFWLEEFAAPYYVFQEAGAEIVLASPKGGQPPLDPKSNEPNFQTDLTHRFEADPAAKAQLASTVRLDSVKADDFDTVFYPGGHGPRWDLAEDSNSIKLIEAFLTAGKPFALVCHAPGALRHVKTADGRPVVEGKNVTGFTNSEEEAVDLTKMVPFLVEDELKAKGGRFSKTVDWGVHVVSDGLLSTGQNPASSGPAAKVLLERLAKLSEF
jgi:putative intracellular protease/amidase